MNFKTSAVISLCASLGACASAQFTGPEQFVQAIDRPAVGAVATASIGDHLLEKGELIEEEALEVLSPVKGIAYSVAPGVYRQLGHNEEDDFYSPEGVTRGGIFDPFQAIAVAKKPGAQLCILTVYGGKACYDAQYERRRVASVRGNSFQQTLIYSGRVGDKINVSYREFSNSMARPAFNNDVEYDLSSSKIIGYKGAQLEILSADNTGVTYRVISNFK